MFQPMPLVLAVILLPALELQPALQTPAPVHVLKIAAGPAGIEEKGTFVLKEERSIFNRSDDREVIVLFQWEGAPGPHKLAAQWRSPDGGQSSISIIEYVAKDRRFGAYWTLPLSPSIQLGHWSIEATVDGQPAGRYSFEVTDTKVAPAEVKRPLSQAELYDRLTKMFVVLRRTAARGRELEPAAGFIGSGSLYTSMAAVDDVERIQAIGPDGSPRDVTDIIAWNRREDWAVLPGGVAADPLPVAAGDTVKVGDRCFSLEGGTTGGRVLLEGTISGKSTGAGPRLLVTFFTGAGTPGAPVLNEFGELIGLVGAADVPGATRMMHIMRFRALLRGAPIVPFSMVRPAPGAAPAAMADLRARGELIPALDGDEHVLSGGFARAIDRRQTIAPSEQREEFSAREKSFFVFVTWDAKERLRGTTQFRMYDDHNRAVVESKPAKANFSKQQLTFTSIEVPMLKVAGMYRADLLFNGKPVWRGFVRITP